MYGQKGQNKDGHILNNKFGNFRLKNVPTQKLFNIMAKVDLFLN